jgi:MoaA/NifB/PqqE/SkfB family radical SAM enzyme
MFKFDELKNIHLEISNNCQASCPMCIRNIHGGLKNDLVKISNWSLDLYKKVINDEVLNQIKKIYFCGNFGDPILNNDLQKMCEYTKTINPSITLRIHTNGSLRDTGWWSDLVSMLPKDHGVVFALDGLEDTHHLYRIGTDFNKIINNAKAFIHAGGKAEWAFIRFKHNEHQVEQARKLASSLGFEVFTTKDSSRFLLDTKFPVWNKDKETTHYLEPSNYSEIKFIDRNVVKNYKEQIKAMHIECFVQKEREIYIDSFGHLMPCCYLSSTPYVPISHEGDAIPVKHDILEQHYKLVESLGGLPKLDIANMSIKQIIQAEEYQTVWKKYWNEDKLITCARVCGKNAEVSSPNKQIISRDSL